MTDARRSNGTFTRGIWRAVLLLGVLHSGACFQTRPSVGGETHFLRSCDKSCGDGLRCICGVCTQTCATDIACGGLATGATCNAITAGADSCEPTQAKARSCDVTCQETSQCRSLGAAFECDAGRCRAHSATITAAPDASTTPGATSTDAGVCSADASANACETVTMAAVPLPCPPGGCDPLVLLLVDTSGSMERKSGCICTSGGCSECLPRCDLGERNRWVGVLEALTGTYQDYGCSELARTSENGRVYDLDWKDPHFAPLGSQNEDGLLDRYRTQLRFGLATFDSAETYTGADPLIDAAEFDFDRSAGVDGQWSYAPGRAWHALSLRANNTVIGSFAYPNSTNEYIMDTGIRGPQAAEGALTLASEPPRAAEVNDTIQRKLGEIWPYGGTPIAAALDDLFYYLSADPAAAPERALGQPIEIVLISDGEPDSDYRNIGCNCANDEDSTAPIYCGGPPNDPRIMHCPYPTAVEAAHALRCGAVTGADCAAGVATHVYVVAYSVDNAATSGTLDAIAQAGGGSAARVAKGPAELRSVLDSLLSEIRAHP